VSDGPGPDAPSGAGKASPSSTDDPAGYRLDEQPLRSALARSALASWSDALVDAVHARGAALRHGDLPRWRTALEALPHIEVDSVTLDAPTVSIEGRSLPPDDRRRLEHALEALIPWRKGPFDIVGTRVDCEWRSDLKWARLAAHVQPLAGRTVLDVGTGSGYHLWRMRGAGAAFVLGIEPGLLFATQFELLARLVRDPAVQLLPLTLDTLPAPMAAFDSVFSMGVLYHRRDHAAHLAELHAALRPGGELVLETLISPSGDDDELAIDGRYARMRNVHAMPSASRVLRWLVEAGFVDVRLVTVDVTGTDEQRRTGWMPFDSLADALDPHDPALTIEEHPRPRRALMLAIRPA